VAQVKPAHPARHEPVSPVAEEAAAPAEVEVVRSETPEFLAANDATADEIKAVCVNLMAEINQIFRKRSGLRPPTVQFQAAIDNHAHRKPPERREFYWAIMHELRRIAFAYDPIRIQPNFSVGPTRLTLLWGSPFK
jgi:hypothetical protein